MLHLARCALVRPRLVAARRIACTVTKTDEFVVFYRNPWMRHLRFVSRLKLIQVGSVLALIGPISYWYSRNAIEKSTLWLSVAAASASTLTLIVLSYFFRRVVGELGCDATTQRIRLATLTFWGRRRHLYFASDAVVPWTESGGKEGALFRRLEFVGHKETYVYSLRAGLVTNRSLFRKLIMGY